MGRRPMGRKTSIESVLYPQGAAIYERLGIGTRAHNSGPAAASSRLLGLAQTAIGFSVAAFVALRARRGDARSPTLRAFVGKIREDDTASAFECAPIFSRTPQCFIVKFKD